LPDENIYTPALEKLLQMRQSNAREEDFLLLERNAYQEKIQAILQYHETILQRRSGAVPSSVVVVGVLVPPAHDVLATVLDGIEPSLPIQNQPRPVTELTVAQLLIPVSDDTICKTNLQVAHTRNREEGGPSKSRAGGLS
jgi:hypothetical protein